MIFGFIEIINTFYRKNILFFSFFLLILLLMLDFLTGHAIQFPIFYVLPVGILSWSGYKKLSYILSFIMPLARIIFTFIWKGEFDLFEIYTNAFITIIALLLYSYLLNIIYSQTETRKNL